MLICGHIMKPKKKDRKRERKREQEVGIQRECGKFKEETKREKGTRLKKDGSERQKGRVW